MKEKYNGSIYMSGKGDKWRPVNWKRYRSCPLWDNLESKTEECWLNRKDHPLKTKQCCCVCEHRHSVYWHCTTKPDKEDGKCCCKEQKGWACIPPDSERVYDCWPEHGVGCELFTDKRKKQG
jgi:hypothetical protein